MFGRLIYFAVSSNGIAFLSLAINAAAMVIWKRRSTAWNNLETRLEGEISELSQDLDTASKQSGEYARRIAWLESRVRSTRVEPKTATEPALAPKARTTITEKRHRVLSLARRGQDVQTIARTLGMHHGEVELMINLGRAA